MKSLQWDNSNDYNLTILDAYIESEAQKRVYRKNFCLPDSLKFIENLIIFPSKSDDSSRKKLNK